MGEKTAKQALKTSQLSQHPPKNQKLLLIGGAGILAAFVLLAAVFILIVAGSGKNVSLSSSNLAVIPIKGEIFSGANSYDGVLSSEEIADLIKDADSDSSIKAILLDIDSPGGEVVASKQIVYQIRKSGKPVYSYINSLGASGAYYAASATKHIMADEDSLTGSIGVISIFPNFTQLMEKVGVKMTVLKEGKFKAMGNPFGEFSQEEQDLFQKLLSETYQKFRGDVLEFRSGKITSKELDYAADGRILSGRQAHAAKLVDELLPRTELFNRIAELEGVESITPVYYGEESFSFSQFFMTSGRAFGDGFLGSLKSESGMKLQ